MDKQKVSGTEQVLSLKRPKKSSFKEELPSTKKTEKLVGQETRHESGGGSTFSLKTPNFESSDTSLHRIPSDHKSSSDESVRAIVKAHEQYNINKPSGSQNRPVSPPPPRILEKLKQVKKQKRSSTGSEYENDENDVEGDDDEDDDDDDDADDRSSHFESEDLTEAATLNVKIPNIFSDFNYFIEEDDEDDDNFYIMRNPSGSVLAPTANPYNKQERIRQANIDLFKEGLTENESETVEAAKVKFNDNVHLLERESQFSEESEREISTVHADPFTFRPQREREATSVRDGFHKIDAKNGLTEGLKFIGVNPKKLLVMVPSTGNNLPNFLSDNSSSSENEDVCIGYSAGNKIDNENENVITGTELLPTYEQTKEESFENEEIFAKNLMCGAGDGKDVGDLDTNPNLTTLINSDKNFEHNGEGDTDFGPENNTGIQIKITCPSCSDILNSAEFCSTNNENSSCGTNYDNTKGPLHSCNSTLINQEGDSIHDNTKTVLKSKNHLRNKQNDLPIAKNNLLKSINSSLQSSRTMNKNAKNRSSLPAKSTENDGLKSFFTKSKGNKENQKTHNLKGNNGQKLVNSGDQLDNKILQKKKNGLLKNKINIKIGVIISTNDKDKGFCPENENLTKDCTVRSLEHLESDPAKKCIPKENGCCSRKKGRPKSCPDYQSKPQHILKRPVTAPVFTKRDCCSCSLSRLPEYNGFRSEYGLSEEQLQERRRLKFEKNKLRKLKKEVKSAEEERKRRENEEMFSAWLAKKNEQAKKKKMHNRMYPCFPLRRYSAPATRITKSNNFLKLTNSNMLRRPLTINKLLNNATAQEKRTYRIYLGLETN